MNFLLHQFLFFTFITFTILTSFPKIFENNGYSYFIIGFLMMFMQITNLILSLLFTKFTFKGKYLTYIYGMLFLNIVSLYFFIDNLYLTGINFFIFAMLYSISFTYNDSMILEKYKEKFGQFRAIGSAFFVLMSIFSYFYIHDVNVIFQLMVIASLIMFINSFFLTKGTKTTHQNIKITKQHVLNEKNLYLFAILFNLSLGVYFSFYSIFLIELGYTINQVFIIFGLSVASETITLFFQHKIINKNIFFNVFNIMIASMVFTIIRFILIQLFPHEFSIQIIANLLHLFTFSLFFSSMLLYLKDKYPNEHFIYSKLYRGIGFGIGGTIGALLSGILYTNYGNYFFYIPAIFTFISIYFLFKLKKENSI